VAAGASIQVGATIAVLHRTADKGIATLVGMLCYMIARRRHRLSGFRLFGRRPAPEQVSAAAAGTPSQC
jgi:hypothetical protein